MFWPFNHYPGTDYETFNWEWLIRLGKRWENIWPKVESAMNAVEQSASAAADSANAAADSANAAANSASAAANSATAAASIVNYVTPEMYGAVGDGVTDDSGALQAALNSGMPVKCLSSATYYIGQDVTMANHDALIDFNNSSLIIGGTIRFEQTPVRFDNISYIANSGTIQNISADNGIINVIDDYDNFYSNVKKGFSSLIKDNYLQTRYPYDINGHALFYPLMTVSIQNIGDIKCVDTTRKDAFEFIGCIVQMDNITAKDYAPLNIMIASACSVNADNWNVSSKNRPSDNYHYAIGLNACSKWFVNHFKGKSDWSSIALNDGGNGQSLYGLLQNSEIRSYTSAFQTYGEHPGTGIDTTLDNVVLDGGATNGGTIKNSTIYENPWHQWLADNANYKQDVIIDNCRIYKQYTMTYTPAYVIGITDQVYGGKFVIKNSFLDLPVNSYINTRTAAPASMDELVIDNITVRSDGISNTLNATNETDNPLFNLITVKNTNIWNIVNGLKSLGCQLLRIVNCTDSNSTVDCKVYVSKTPIRIERCNFDTAHSLRARTPGTENLNIMYSRFDPFIYHQGHDGNYPFTGAYNCNLSYQNIT